MPGSLQPNGKAAADPLDAHELSPCPLQSWLDMDTFAFGGMEEHGSDAIEIPWFHIRNMFAKSSG